MIKKPFQAPLSAKAPAVGGHATHRTVWEFKTLFGPEGQFLSSFYDAWRDNPATDFRKRLAHVDAMWNGSGKLSSRELGTARNSSSYRRLKQFDYSQCFDEGFGSLFTEIGQICDADPYALAAFCVFESYNDSIFTYNPHHLDPAVEPISERKEDGVAAGIASTQANEMRGTRIPFSGSAIPLLDRNTKKPLLDSITKMPLTVFPATTAGTAALLRDQVQIALRCIAKEFKDKLVEFKGDLVLAFPHVAVSFDESNASHPNRKKKKPWHLSEPRANYGTKAQYVSRAYALYEEFKRVDHSAGK